MKNQPAWPCIPGSYLQYCALALCFALMAFQSDRNTGGQLLVCGNSKVMIVQEKSQGDTIPEILWTWDATLAKDLPEKYRLRYFNTIDECKPLEGGRKILITSSGGGVAILNRADKKVLFYAYVGNAHSAELLPGNKVVVAGSGLPGTKGNSLEVFDSRQSEKRVYRDTLARGHGVVWDKEQQILYALGYDILNEYKLVDWDSHAPVLKLIRSHRLPSDGGHDLQSFPDGSLFVSTSQHNWLFDKVGQSFKPFEPLKNSVNIKSLSHHPASNRTIYTIAEESWWTHRVYFLKTKSFLAFPDIKVYKARWVTPDINFDGQAHRGGAGLMPENTVAAAKNALRLGCTIEMDVYMSRDSQLIVTHDPHIMSAYTLDPNGREISKEQEKTLVLKNMDYAEIRKYDIGSKAFDSYPRKKLVPAYIPRLSDLIDSAEAYAKANHLKSPSYNIQMGPAYTLTPEFREDFIRKMMAVIIAKKIQKRAMFQSFDLAVLKDVHRLYPDKIQISYLLGASRKDFAANLKQLTFKPDVYSPHFSLVTPELVENCRKEKIKLIPWTVNTQKDIDDLRAMGVDGIITDYPDLF